MSVERNIGWKLKGLKDCRMIRAAILYILHEKKYINIERELVVCGTDVCATLLNEKGAKKYAGTIHDIIFVFVSAYENPYVLDDCFKCYMLADMTMTNKELSQRMLAALKNYLCRFQGVPDKIAQKANMMLGSAPSFVFAVHCVMAISSASGRPAASNKNAADIVPLQNGTMDEFVSETEARVLTSLLPYIDVRSGQYNPEHLDEWRRNILERGGFGTDRGNITEAIKLLNPYSCEKRDSAYNFTANILTAFEREAMEYRLDIDALRDADVRLRMRADSMTDEDCRLIAIMRVIHEIGELGAQNLKYSRDALLRGAALAKVEKSNKTLTNELRRWAKAARLKDSNIQKLTEKTERLESEADIAENTIAELKKERMRFGVEKERRYIGEIARLTRELKRANTALAQAEKKSG